MRRRDIFFKDDGKDDIKKRLNAWIEKQKLTDSEKTVGGTQKSERVA